jgi:hypothetical protein
MFRIGSIILRVLAALLLIGLLVGGGMAVYRAGFAQGYAVGASSATAGGAEVAPGGAPLSPYYPYYPGMMYPHFGFFPFMPLGGLCLFGLLIFFAFGALLRGPRHWGHHAWAHGPEGGPHGHWHGYPPPWAKERQAGESTGEGKDETAGADQQA